MEEALPPDFTQLHPPASLFRSVVLRAMNPSAVIDRSLRWFIALVTAVRSVVGAVVLSLDEVFPADT